jgi:hypothetical protein
MRSTPCGDEAGKRVIGGGWQSLAEGLQTGVRAGVKLQLKIVALNSVFVLISNTNLVEYEHAFYDGLRAPT